MANCELCGDPMPAGEEMFKYHGYSGPCPKAWARPSGLPYRCEACGHESIVVADTPEPRLCPNSECSTHRTRDYTADEALQMIGGSEGCGPGSLRELVIAWFAQQQEIVRLRRALEQIADGWTAPDAYSQPLVDDIVAIAQSALSETGKGK